jgi:hypothetical protein
MERTPKFKVGGVEFNTLEEAQRCEITEIILDSPSGNGPALDQDSGERLAAWLVGKRELIISILKSTGRKPRVAKAKSTSARPVKAGAKPNSNREMLKAKTQFKPQEPTQV